MILASWFRYLYSPRPRPRAKRRRAVHARSGWALLVLEYLEIRAVLAFLGGVTYAAGPHPIGVAVADVNGDGIPDIAAANYVLSGSVSVLLGNGDGSFQAPRTFAAGTYSISVAVGDFNGDGILDLAVANASSNNVSVLLGHGDGTFQPPVNYAVGSEPSSLVVGHFHDPNVLALAVGHSSGATVSVLLGTGDGTFQPAVNFAAGTYPSFLAVADFNRDGIDDLVTGNQGSDNVSILLANGDGSFQPALNFREGEFGTDSVAVGDFNGDGWPDVASVSDGVSVRLNDGNWPGSPDGAPHTGSGPGFGRQPRRHWPGAERALVSLGAAQTVRATPESALPTPAAGIAPRASVSAEFAVGLLDQLFAGIVREQPRVTLWRLAARARVWRDAWFTLDSDDWSALNGGA